MPSLQQIEVFKKRARAAGFSEAQIAAEVARKQQEENNAALQTKQTQTQVQTTQQPSVTTPSPQPQKSTLSKVGNFAINAGKTIFNGPARLGEALGTAATQSQANKQNQQIEEQTLQTVNQLSAKADQAERTGNKAQAIRLRKLAQENLKLVNKNAKALADTAETTAENAVKGGVGTAALLVPGGATAKARIVAGTLSGGMSGYGASKKGEELSSTVGGAITGAAVSGVLEGAGAVVRKIRGTGKDNILTKAGDAFKEDVRHIRVKPSIYGASKEKAINKTLNELGISGTPDKQYEQLLPAMEELSNRIDEALSKKPGSVNSKELVDKFYTKLKSVLRTSDLNKKQVQNVINEYVNDLYSAASGGKEIAGDITNAELLRLKQIAFEDYGRAFAKQQAGQNLTPKEEVAMKAWSVIDEALAKLNPEVKKMTVMQSQLYQAAPSLQSARNTVSTTRAFGTTIPAGVKNAAVDKAGNMLKTAGELPSKMPNVNVPQSLRNVGIGTTSNLLSGNELNNPSETSDQEDSDITQTNQGSGDEADNQQGLERNNLLNTANIQPHPIFGNMTKQEVLLDAFKQGISQKALNEIASIYDQFAEEGNEDELSDTFLETGEPVTRADRIWMLENPDKVPGAKGKATEKERMFDNASTAAQKALELLKSGKVKTGVGQGVAGQVGEKIGTNSQEQQRYRASIALARTTARNALLGANMTEKELESIQAFIPEYNDAPKIAQEKLETFIELMNQFSGM